MGAASLEFCLQKRGQYKIPRALGLNINDFQLGNICETAFEAVAFTYLMDAQESEYIGVIV